MDINNIVSEDLREVLENETEEKILQLINTGLKTIEYRNKYSKTDKAKEYRKTYGQKQRELIRELKQAKAEGRF